jgi:large subunit ribosomal protein L36
MKVRASIKKRSADCKIVRRKGKLYIINKICAVTASIKNEAVPET